MSTNPMTTHRVYRILLDSKKANGEVNFRDITLKYNSWNHVYSHAGNEFKSLFLVSKYIKELIK